MVLYSPALLGNRMIEIQILKIKNVSTQYAYDPHAIKKLAATVMRWNVVNDTDTGRNNLTCYGLSFPTLSHKVVPLNQNTILNPKIILICVRSVSVPKSWFLHFYIFSSLYIPSLLYLGEKTGKKFPVFTCCFKENFCFIPLKYCSQNC